MQLRQSHPCAGVPLARILRQGSAPPSAESDGRCVRMSVGRADEPTTRPGRRPARLGMVRCFCVFLCTQESLRGGVGGTPRQYGVPVLWGELCVMWYKAGAVQGACVLL